MSTACWTGHGPHRIVARTAPAAKRITGSEWQEHFKQVWNAHPHVGTVVEAATRPSMLFRPVIAGPLKLQTAARAQKRSLPGLGDV